MELAVASVVLDKLSAMVVDKTCQEITLVCNFTGDFNWLKQLTSIHDFLAEANSRAVEDKLVKNWLLRVRDVAWDAEDIVEECASRPLYASNVTQSCVCDPLELIFRYRMAKRIQKVNERVRSITEDGQKLRDLRDIALSLSGEPSSSAARKENCLLPSDSYPVGIERKVEKLISMINESAVSVIAVVGMGGAGKTFLLRNVYRTIKQYEHKIWLSISQSYSIDQLLMDLVSRVQVLKNSSNNVSAAEAAEFINRELQGTKSLIVFDDVWTSTAGQNNIIQRLGLPVGPHSQCKVVVTTRSMEICRNLEASLYKMELLSEQESWHLFCSHAFRGNVLRSHLKGLPSQVEKHCGRLPLALKIIGSSLYGCTEERLWESRLNKLKVVDFKGEIDPNSESVMKILKLSYDSLSQALKLCFSYLSFFPWGASIDPEYLINLWIAEGFIPQGDDQWDTAWGYLYQLANLCFLEVEEDEYLVKDCKIHGLMLDLAILISKEHQCQFSVHESFRSVKRILLQKKKIEDLAIVQSRASCPKSLRTLSLYETPIEKIEEKFVSRMRLLRVLDLSKTKISTLPACVGKLKILKLLNLSSTKIEEVPICVKNLKSLLFLDLSHCSELQGLPKWINKLKCLEHLIINGCEDELTSHMPKGISELVALRVLKSSHLRLSVEENGFLKLEDVAKLTSLQELSLEVQEKMKDGTFAQPLQMRRLSVKSTLSGASHQPPNLSAMRYLQTLKLENFLVPNWVYGLPDLVQLSLVKCDCSNYGELQALPNLKKLLLDGNTSCEKLPEVFGKQSGFPKLRFLTIQNFCNLKKLPELEGGAMAVLEEFYVGDCPQVSEVPEGLECLTKLRKFYYTGDENDRLNKGQDFWDNIRTSINARRSSQVKIIVTIF